jgi:hypothetical protein
MRQRGCSRSSVSFGDEGGPLVVTARMRDGESSSDAAEAELFVADEGRRHPGTRAKVDRVVASEELFWTASASWTSITSYPTAGNQGRRVPIAVCLVS